MIKSKIEKNAAFIVSAVHVGGALDVRYPELDEIPDMIVYSYNIQVN